MFSRTADQNRMPNGRVHFRRLALSVFSLLRKVVGQRQLFSLCCLNDPSRRTLFSLRRSWGFCLFNLFAHFKPRNFTTKDEFRVTFFLKMFDLKSRLLCCNPLRNRSDRQEKSGHQKKYRPQIVGRIEKSSVFDSTQKLHNWERHC